MTRVINQKLKLFNRGNSHIWRAISICTNQLHKTADHNRITKKKDHKLKHAQKLPVL